MRPSRRALGARLLALAATAASLVALGAPAVVAAPDTAPRRSDTAAAPVEPLPELFLAALPIQLERSTAAQRDATLERDRLAAVLAAATLELDRRRAELDATAREARELDAALAERTEALHAMLVRRYTSADPPLVDMAIVRSGDQRFVDRWGQGISDAAIDATSAELRRTTERRDELRRLTRSAEVAVAALEGHVADLSSRHAAAVAEAERRTTTLTQDLLTAQAVAAGGPLRRTLVVPEAAVATTAKDLLAGTTLDTAPGATADAPLLEPTVLHLEVGLRAVQAYWAASVTAARTLPSCRLGWWVLAAIGQVESHHGGALTPDGVTTVAIRGPVLDGTGGRRHIPDSDHGELDGDTVYDRAVGPMQFLPGTWRTNGVDADGDGRADPSDLDDAAAAAARYLCRRGGDLTAPGDLAAALRRYNNSDRYVSTVSRLAEGYRSLFDHLPVSDAG